MTLHDIEKLLIEHYGKSRMEEAWKNLIDYCEEDVWYIDTFPKGWLKKSNFLVYYNDNYDNLYYIKQHLEDMQEAAEYDSHAMDDSAGEADLQRLIAEHNEAIRNRKVIL